MLDTRNMKFIEKQDERSPMVFIKGCVQILSERTVDSTEQIPGDVIREEMRESVWRYTYGDLFDPLMRLQRLAKIYMPLPHQEEMLACCEQLNALLTRKSPDDK